MRIDISTAKRLLNNYKQNHWPVINGGCPSLHQNPGFPNMQDSRSAWFSLADLNAFISDIENKGGDGIRFYFGEYSADLLVSTTTQPLPAGAQQYAGLHTLVMIPTKPDMNGVSHDINIANIDPSDFTNGTDLAAENHGTLAPPPWYINGQFPAQATLGLDFMTFCDQNP